MNTAIWVWLAAQCAVWVGLWVWTRRRKRTHCTVQKHALREESRELAELRRMRERKLNMPLTERTRPACMEDIIGQAEGIRALRAAMCGPNPQHVIIYGPPGCGKTCAARLVLEEARKRIDSPFDANSRFVEVDATCVRFDERAIADPLMGSVHDPIYQGAGALGNQGVPQPKPGAVTRAHCGILFLDEIGELHPLQMNKLLKVLEDRKVFFDSAYYSRDNSSIPPYIHEIFQNGLPADFRLVGATTRSPEELPPALRSRCTELFFRALNQSELETVTRGAAERMGLTMQQTAISRCAQYCQSGRDVINLVQLAGGAAYDDGRAAIMEADVEWAARVTHSARRYIPRIPETPVAGSVYGLAVTGAGEGVLLEIECAVCAARERGSVRISGAVEEEELEMRQRKLRRKSTAYTSAENVLDTFKRCFGVDCSLYDIRFNIPGGMPMDGPSAGVALAVALMSAFTKKAPIQGLALTGEITVQGAVRPVGGVREKLDAAIAAGAQTVLIPEENWEDEYLHKSALIMAVSDIVQVMRIAFAIPQDQALAGVLPFICSA